MAHERLAGRIQRLLDARTKLTQRLENEPNGSRSALCTAKIAEYDRSLANLEQYGQEMVPTGNKVSVKIDVPAGKFTVEAQEPGV